MARYPAALAPRLSLALASLALATLAPEARANDHADCVTSADQGQTLRDAHKLLQARDALRLCGRASCPAAIQKDCITWAEQLEPRISSVVLSATNAAGAPIAGVQVTLDGKVLRTQLDGSAIELDPGSHTVSFDAPDGTHVEKTILAREGEKNALVTVTLGKPAGAATPPSSSAHGTGTVGYLGYGIGGLGIMSVIVGGIFGSIAMSDNSKANCNSSSKCVDPQSEKSANGAATMADVGVIAGVALAAAGVTMVLVDRSSAHVQATPVAYGTGGAGLSIRGVW